MSLAEIKDLELIKQMYLQMKAERDEYQEKWILSKKDRMNTSWPLKLFLKISSSGEQVIIRHSEMKGGKYMIYLEKYVKPLLSGEKGEVYADWIADREGWKRKKILAVL